MQLRFWQTIGASMLVTGLFGNSTDARTSAGAMPSIHGALIMRLWSPDFKKGHPLPAKFTCQGANISPTLKWANIPSQAKSLVLVMDDPDAPNRKFTHWGVVDISPKATGIPQDMRTKPFGSATRNDFGKIGYGGPCPPPGKMHHYYFRLFALKEKLNLKRLINARDILDLIRSKSLRQAVLMGTCKR